MSTLAKNVEPWHEPKGTEGLRKRANWPSIFWRSTSHVRPSLLGLFLCELNFEWGARSADLCTVLRPPAWGPFFGNWALQRRSFNTSSERDKEDYPRWIRVTARSRSFFVESAAANIFGCEKSPSYFLKCWSRLTRGQATRGHSWALLLDLIIITRVVVHNPMNDAAGPSAASFRCCWRRSIFPWWTSGWCYAKKENAHAHTGLTDERRWRRDMPKEICNGRSSLEKSPIWTTFKVFKVYIHS